MIQGGQNYSTPPTPIFGYQLPNNVFNFYTYDGFYVGDDNNITYSAAGPACESTAAYVDVDSAGVGYEILPPAKGLIKKGYAKRCII